ncbi:MAG TPA: O-antigen ligase family protein, partial [Longimicrobiaceae bacterium]
VARAGLARPLLAGLGLAVALGAATSLLQTYGVRTDLFSLNRAPGGTLGNRNFVAHLAAFGLPVLLLCALRAYRAPGFLLGAVGVALSAGTLVLTRSRAAYLALAAVLAVLLLGTMIVRPVRRSGRVLGRFVTVLGLAGAGVAAAVALPNTLRWRTETPYAETVRGVVNYQEGSGRGRLVQYRNSLRMAASSPLLGVGPGNWAVVYPEFASRRDPSMDREVAGITSNPWPSSDWVAFLSERGVPAFVLLVLALAGLALSAWRRMLSARDADEGLLALALLATLGAVATVGAFDAVLLLALPTLLVWAALGALAPAVEMRPARAAPALRAGVLLLAALAAGASAARSAAQIAAMDLYAGGGGREALERAARLDPGNYRVRLRLARNSRSTASRCEHALAARELYPSAGAAKRAAAGCD